MQKIPTPIHGAFILEPSLLKDERGYFYRQYCGKFFESQGLNKTVPQINIVHNHLAGTVRGMHYQTDPYAETKVVHCIKGSIFDVIVDLRPSSPTYMKWYGIELSDENRLMLYIDVGLAHGYQTLTDNSELLYLMGEFYNPEFAAGVRYDDPIFGIAWPLKVSEISQKDRNYPDYIHE